MSGEITRSRDGKAFKHRPAYIYLDASETTIQQLEMMESVRNVLEEIKGSQMLQCDVAHAIKGLCDEARRMRLVLARIDRRLAKVEKIK